MIDYVRAELRKHLGKHHVLTHFQDTKLQRKKERKKAVTSIEL
jgi:hypothetical protein